MLKPKQSLCEVWREVNVIHSDKVVRRLTDAGQIMANDPACVL